VPGRSSTDLNCASTPGSSSTAEQRLAAIEVRQKLDQIAVAVAAALRSLPPPPGRRIAALLAGGWTSEVIEPGDMLKAWRPALQAADQLRFALYPVDVPGMSQAFLADASRGGIYLDDFGASSGSAERFSSFPDSGVLDEGFLHSTLHYLAQSTGGVASVNVQRRHVLSRISEEARAYYSIGFSAPLRHDDTAHAIEIEVGDGSFKVRHRRGYEDVDVATETRIALESAILGAETPTSPELSVTFGEPKTDGKRRVRVPLRLRLKDPERNPAKTYELRLIAEDEEGRRTEVGPEVATLRHRGGPETLRGGDLEMVLRDARHTVAVSLRDAASGKLYVARLTFQP